MRNYRYTGHVLLSVVLCGIVVLINSCKVLPKQFTADQLFHGSFYESTICKDQQGYTIADKDIKVYHLGFNQQYVVNNNVIELSTGTKRESAVHNVTEAVDKYNSERRNKIAPRDSQAVYIIEMKVPPGCGDRNKEKMRIDTVGTRYAFISIKYTQFKRDNVKQYLVSGFGHVYIGEKQGENNILFFKSAVIKGGNSGGILAKLFKPKTYYYIKSGKKDNTLMLFENHYDPKDRVPVKSNDSVKYFQYIVIGNHNQIGGNKYLDICIDSVFQDRKPLTFRRVEGH